MCVLNRWSSSLISSFSRSKMPVGRNRRRIRLVTAVTRSPTQNEIVETIQDDEHRLTMERQVGDFGHIPDESQAARATRITTTIAALPPHGAMETQRRLVVYAHRVRQLLSHRSLTDHLSLARREELWREIHRIKNEIQTLQGQTEVTTHSVASMERLTSHLERLTRNFASQGTRTGTRSFETRIFEEITVQRQEQNEGDQNTVRDR